MTPFETIELRTHGFARFLVSGFLVLWLCGWAVGEWFVLRVLWGIFSGNAGPSPEADSFPGSGLPGIGIVFFLVVWLVFWTFGGIAALVTAARMLAGVDRIEVRADGFAVRQGVGPFERTAWFDRTKVRALYVRRRDSAIVAVVGPRTISVSALGTIEERRAAAERLRSLLGIEEGGTIEGTAIPDGWVERTGPDGSVELIDLWRNHAGCIGFGFALGAVALFGGAAAGYAITNEGERAGTGAIISIIVGLAIIAISLAVAVGHDRIVLRPGRLVLERKFGIWTRTTDIRDARLHVEHSVGDDSDEHATLRAISPSRRVKVFSRVNDSPPVVRLARRVAEVTRWELTLDEEVRSDGS